VGSYSDLLRTPGVARIIAAQLTARFPSGMLSLAFLCIAAPLAQVHPLIWKYVVECLFEPDDQEIKLSEEDQGTLAMVMKTVIDVLDSSVR